MDLESDLTAPMTQLMNKFKFNWKLDLISNRIRSLTNSQLLKLGQLTPSIRVSGGQANVAGFYDAITKRQCYPKQGNNFGLNIYHIHPQNCGLVGHAISNLFKINSSQQRWTSVPVNAQKLYRILTRTKQDLIMTITIQFIRTTSNGQRMSDGGHTLTAIRIGSSVEIFQSDEDHYHMRNSHRKQLTCIDFNRFLLLITQSNLQKKISPDLVSLWAKIIDPLLPFDSKINSPTDPNIYQFDEIDFNVSIQSVSLWSHLKLIANVNRVTL
jgi:hypothetical protein